MFTITVNKVGPARILNSQAFGTFIVEDECSMRYSQKTTYLSIAFTIDSLNAATACIQNSSEGENSLKMHKETLHIPSKACIAEYIIPLGEMLLFHVCRFVIISPCEYCSYSNCGVLPFILSLVSTRSSYYPYESTWMNAQYHSKKPLIILKFEECVCIIHIVLIRALYLNSSLLLWWW